MARVKKDAVPVSMGVAPPIQQTLIIEPDVITDGDFAGMTVDEVLRLTSDAINDAMGNVTIEAAGAALDQVIGEYLDVVRHINGDRSAKESAIRFCETALPFLTLEIEASKPYGLLRKKSS